MKTLFQQNLIDAKYHISVVKRMYENYQEYQSKRFLVGIINELSKASSNAIKTFLIIEKIKPTNKIKDLEVFNEKIAPKYLDKESAKNLLKTIEIKNAQKNSPIQFSRNDKIILLIKGKYKFLTLNRLKELIDSVDLIVKKASNLCRQI